MTVTTDPPPSGAWARYRAWQGRQPGLSATGLLAAAGTAVALVVVSVLLPWPMDGGWGLLQAAAFGLAVGLAMIVGNRVAHRRRRRQGLAS